MPKEPLNDSNATALTINPPIEMSKAHRWAVERTILGVCGGDDTQTALVLKICAYNSAGKPSQLLPRYFRKMKGLEHIEDGTLSRLRQKVNKFPKLDSAAFWELPYFLRFKDQYVVTFERNPNFHPPTDPQSNGVSPISHRIISLNDLLLLERPKSGNGLGRLLPGEDLIVQGRTPLLVRPEMAAVVLDNMEKGVCYQFVFPHDAVAEVALAVSVLLSVSRPLSIDEIIKKIGSKLEIYLSQNVWPFVVSVHNARNDVEAKSYLRIPDSDMLVELCSGQGAHRIAEEIRASMSKGKNLVGKSWFRSPTIRHFRSDFVRHLEDRLQIKVNVDLKERLFGKP